MDDEGDFKKARGFLLTYSALVLALWYFGADLTQFKLMGNEVQLHQRTDSVWLVLAIVNIYFWFRYYQRVPLLGLYFDDTMNDLYDKTLAWVAIKLKRRAVTRLAHVQLVNTGKPELKIRFSTYESSAIGRHAQETNKRRQTIDALELHQISRSARTKINLRAGFIAAENGVWSVRPTVFQNIIYEPSALVTWPVKAFVIVRGAFVIVRGAFVTPWFTDHIAPLVLGGISTILALWKWWDINFVSTAVSHTALQCVG